MATVVKKCDCTNQRACKHNWIVRYRDSQGKQRERSFKHDQKTIAGKFGNEIEHQKSAGEYVDYKQGDVKFRDYSLEWLNRKTGIRTDGTISNYRSLLAMHINPHIGAMTLTAMSGARGRDAVETLLTETLKADLGPGRVKLAYIVIKSIMNDAIKRGIFTSHRLNGIELPSPTAKSDFVFPEHDQLVKMVAAMPAEYRLAVWLMRGIGVRIGEVLGLKESDFSDGIVRIREQQLPKLGYAPLKHRRHGQYRDVPVPSYVSQMVAEHTPQPDGRLFAPVYHFTFQRWFERARKTAGIPEGFTPHSLRHVFASVALANGVPITDVSFWLGHRDIQTTYGIYGHLVPSSFSRARAILDAEYQTWSGNATLNSDGIALRAKLSR